LKVTRQILVRITVFSPIKFVCIVISEFRFTWFIRSW